MAEFELIQTQLIGIEYLETNEGQVEGLPANPRYITKADFNSLVESIRSRPDMLALRELIAYKHNGKFVVVGGNQRLRAGRKLEFTEMPVKVLPFDTPIKVLREISIKDNGSWGKDDLELLANEWNDDPLFDWAPHLPDAAKKKSSEEFFEDQEPPAKPEVLKIVFEYTADDGVEVMDALRKHPGTKEEYLWQLLGLGSKE